MHRSIGILLLLICTACGEDGSSSTRADLLFTGGTVYDGSGAVGFHADVAVRGDTIVAIGSLDRWTTDRRIELSGLAIVPGFVDMHSHADLILTAGRPLAEELLAAKLQQGITTILIGNCGLGTAPSNRRGAEILAAVNGWMTPLGTSAEPLSFGSYLDAIEAAGPPLNVAALVPHGALRSSVAGLRSGPLAESEISTMRSALEEAFDQGAWGLSFGLIYPPGMFSPTEELSALAGVAARHERLISAHIRGSSELLLPATREWIEVARQSGARAQHSHLEAVGEPYWPLIEEVLALEDAARLEGVDIAHDVFPYTRAATMMLAIFPPAALEGGLPALLERLADPLSRARIRETIERQTPTWPPWTEGGWPHNLVSAVGWRGIRIASLGENRPDPRVGASLAELSERLGRPPFEIVADLMLEFDGRVGQSVEQISGFDGREEGLERILVHPQSSVISDAEDYGRGSPHPAAAGAFAKALRWNRERRLLPWEVLIHKMTGGPAARIGLTDRGRLQVGDPADLVVIDLETVTDRSEGENRRQTAIGIDWVLLGGQVVVENGIYRGGAKGSVLRHPAGGMDE
jgi:N-acyl-D-amino-acid deacylase